MDTNTILQRFKELYAVYENFDKNKIPLCAAETYVSPFVKQALSSKIEGKYVMGSDINVVTDDFIGSSYLRPIYRLLTEQCNRLFGAKFADARSLTGMNCDMLVLMSVVCERDRILLTTPEQGGHSSVPKILDRLGIAYDSVPYDYNNYQIDYSAVNKALATGKYQFLMFCQSDLIQPPDLSQLDIPHNVTLLYDGTQTMGMIASGVLPNPLHAHEKTILFGGTHKTLPGPTCGLILGNNEMLMKQLDVKINPDYLRNTQVNNVAGLLLALIEQELHGKEYQNKTVKFANMLGKKLEDRSFRIAHLPNGQYSTTHQIFILSDEESSNTLYNNSIRYNVTLNKKHKKLFGDFGTRLGLQEIARYDWQERDLDLLAELLVLLSKHKVEHNRIMQIIETLSQKKTPLYRLEDYFMSTE